MYKRVGVGADNTVTVDSTGTTVYGPPMPTIAQSATQDIQDITKAVGIPNFAYYIGIALIGYVAYQYMSGEAK
jgi:hypothetical protein